MGTVVLDSSVVIGFLDPNDALHGPSRAAIAQLRMNGQSMTLPASVLSECLVGAARNGVRDIRRVHALLTQMFGLARPIDEEIAIRAAEVRAARTSLRLPDALVIATGLVDAADEILTADKRWVGVYDRIRLLGETDEPDE